MSEETQTTEPEAGAAEPEAKETRKRERPKIAPAAVEGLPEDEVRKGGIDTGWNDAFALMDSTPGTWYVLTSYSKRASSKGREKELTEQHGEKGYEFAARTVDGSHNLYGRKVA